MLTNQENIGEPPFETEASKAKRKLRKRLLKQFKREGRLDLVENIDEELEKYMQNEKSALNIETDFKTKISDSTSASEATVANEYETHHETEEEESNEVKITASNVGIISTFICITQQIQALTEQKESLLPFIPKEIIEKVTKRKRRASSQLIIVPKKRKVTAYLMFFRDIKKDEPNISMKEAGNKWKLLPEEDRKKYKTIADERNENIENNIKPDEL